MARGTNRVNISHHEFADFTGSAFHVLHSDQDFTDVTLVCDEDKQIKAHKVIISSSSVLFRRILLKNPHTHPLIYLKGVDYEHLRSILHFIYLGQIELAQEDLEQFIATAKELEVNGLADVIHSRFDKAEHDDSTLDFNELKNEEEYLQDSLNDVDKSFLSETGNDTFENLSQIDDNPDQLLINFKSEKQMEQESKIYNCGHCAEGFSGKSNLKKHVRTLHEGLTYPLTNAERARICREKRKTLIPEGTLKEMNKVLYQRKHDRHMARRMEDEDYNTQIILKNRERVRRFREKRSLEEALAIKRERDMF